MHLHPHASAESETPLAPAPEAPSSLRRRIAWAAGIIALLLLLVLLPPFISVNRYRREIASTMSASLGRPVHLDNVSLHLFPTVGFSLSNFVVSEDPAFGSEPTIRANTVEATLRLTSLWRRPVEFSTVRFVEPSVNLVRNEAGGWNLSGILLHASRVDTAPTGQQSRGPAPRFPYIEATNGRVNIKFGQEKLPFSLTGTDFALWLPSSQLWKVRLKGQPARTDSYITDPGTVRIEGQLRRAASAATLPVDLSASWHDAPLGEASRLLTGEDMGWRGTLNLDAALRGLLGDARISSQLTLGGLRRADFFPTHPLALQATCASRFNISDDSLHSLRCDLPDDAPQPLSATAETISLQHPAAARYQVEAADIPVRWGLLWAALYSPRITVDSHPRGTIDVDLHHNDPAAPVALPVLAHPGRKTRQRRGPATSLMATAGVFPWTGTISLTLPAAGQAMPPASPEGAETTPVVSGSPAVNVLQWRVDTLRSGAGSALRLAPTPVRLGGASTLTVSALISRAGYSLSANGNAAPAAVLLPARYLPQLADGIETVLPYPPTGSVPSRLELECQRSWGSPQTCTGSSAARAAAGSVSPSTAVPAVSSSPAASRPTLLTPQSLSPYDHASPLSPAPRNGP